MAKSVPDELQNARMELDRLRADAMNQIRGAQMKLQMGAEKARSKLKQRLQDIAVAGKDAAQKIQQQKAEAEAQGQPLPTLPETAAPAPTRVMNGVQTGVDAGAIAEQLMNNPASVQGGGAVQAGGGVEIPGLDQIPQNITTRRQTTGVQMVPHDYGVLPVETTTSQVETQPNVLRPQDVLRLKMQQAALEDERQSRVASLTVDLARTYGSNLAAVAGVAEALMRGDTAQASKALGGRKTLSEIEHDALSRVRDLQAQKTMLEIQKLQQETGGMGPMPITALGGLRPLHIAQQSLEKTSPQQTEDNWAQLFKEGKFVGNEASLLGMQSEWVDRGQYRPVSGGFWRGKTAKSYPVGPLFQAMTLLSTNGPTPEERKSMGIPLADKDLVEILNKANIKIDKNGRYFSTDDELNNQILDVMSRAADTQATLMTGRQTPFSSAVAPEPEAAPTPSPIATDAKEDAAEIAETAKRIRNFFFPGFQPGYDPYPKK